MTRKAAATTFLSRTNELQQLCVRILSFCESNSLRTGLHIHCSVIKLDLLENLDLCNNLLSLYLKTDGIWNARKMFDEMPQRTVFAWTVMISAYTKSQEPASALSLFEGMMASGTNPNEFTLSSVIRSCADLRDLSYGARVHGSVIKSGFEGNTIIGSSLTHLYSKCEKLKEARRLFDCLQNTDTISWTMMISSLLGARRWKEALQFYSEMVKAGVSSPPNEFTFIKLLGASSFLGLEFGKMIHNNMIVRGIPLNVILKTSLVEFYSRFSKMEDVVRVLKSTGEQDAFLWTSVVSGFVRNLRAKEAVGTFLEMRALGLQPNNFTYTAILSLCSSVCSLDLGKQVHSQIIQVGLENSADVGNALIEMYMKCSALEIEALRVFRAIMSPNVISWTTLILGLVDQGFEQDCFGLLMEMVTQGVEPNVVTLSGVLRACGKSNSIRRVLEIHGYILRRHVDDETLVGNSLIDAYASLDKVAYAWNVARSGRDSITFTTLVTRFNELGKYEMALSVINHMYGDGIRIDQFCLPGFISASANLGALETAKHLHCYSMKSGYSGSVSVLNSLIDMYGKCGSLEDAKKAFEEIANPDVVSWNVLVSGLASNGCISSALSAFEEMRMKGTEPDSVTFLILLSACSNGRLTEMGLEYFQSMKEIYNIEPQIEHYVHLVDILARAGRLEEAIGIIETMQLKPNALIFKTLLRACRYHGNLSVGEDMANKGLALAPFDPAFYILLADLYEESGKPELAKKTRNLMREKGLSKKLSKSSVEVQGKVHSFVNEDVSRVERTNEIYAEIEYINNKIGRLGSTYRGNRKAIFHSAKQAVVFGLLYASPQAPVHIVNNKIMCKDCHEFVSLVTRLFEKNVTVRDGNRVHIFKNGQCSCRKEETSFVLS